MANGLSPPVISRLPFGLLNYLGIKSGGAYPQNLGGTIQPIIDLLEWTAAGAREVVFDVAIPITTLNWNPSTIVVPQTEYWYVDRIGGLIVCDATETVFGHLMCLAFQNVDQALSDPFSPGSSGQQHMNCTQYLPIFMGPGDTLGYMIDVLTGAPLATNAQIRAHIVRLRV